MKPKINMVTLGVQNLEKATNFYEKGLGFPKMDFEGDITFFELESAWLSLYPWDLLAQDATVPSRGSGFRGVSLAHIVDSDHAVLEVLERAQQAGATLIKPGQKTSWGGFSGYFSDLDDHLWEVAHNPFFCPGE